MSDELRTMMKTMDVGIKVMAEGDGLAAKDYASEEGGGVR